MSHRLSFRAQLEELPRLAAWVEGLPLGLDAKRLYAVQLCLEEVVANLALHARPGSGPHVTVTVAIEAAPLRVIVEDDAIPFDSIARPVAPPLTQLETAEIGGLGLTLLRGFSATQDYARIGGRNRLTLGFA